MQTNTYLGQRLSLTAVFAYNSSISVNGMYYANEDEIFSGEGSGTNIEEIQTTTEIGKQSVTISASNYNEFVTVDNVVYERNCMFTQTYDQATEQTIYTIHDSLSIPVAPVYDSVEYWAYLAEYEAPVTIAYVPHTHSYSAATCTTPATCSCGATTGGVDSTNHTGGTEVSNQKEATEFEDGYTGDTYCLGCNTMIEQGEVIGATHTHTYDEDGYQKDANGHWQICSDTSCPDADKGKTESTPHTYDGDTDAICDTCDYTRLILVADETVVNGNGTVTLTSSLPVFQLVCSDERYKDYISGSGENWSFQMKNNVTTDLTFTVTSGSQTASCTVSFVQDPNALILTPSRTSLTGNGTITLTTNKDITGFTCSNQSYETDISGSGQNWQFVMNRNADVNLWFEAATADGETALCWITFNRYDPPSSSSDDDDYTPPIATDTEQNEDGDTVTTAEPISVVRNDKATTTITITDGNRLVNEVVRNGSDQLVIAPKIVGDVSSAEISIPSSVMERFVERTNADLQLVTPIADGTLDYDTLAKYMGGLLMETRRTGNAISTKVTIGGETVIDAGIELPEGVEMTDDMKLIVSTEKATLAPIEGAVVEKASLGDLQCPEEYDILTDDDTVGIYGIDCELYETIMISGREYILLGSSRDGPVLIRFPDGRGMVYSISAGSFTDYHDSSFDRTVEKPTNTTVTIDGVTYDVAYIVNNSTYILYRDGQLAGMYPSTDDAADLHGSVQFYEGYDPETLKAQQDDNDLGSVTIPADYNNAAIADFAPGKTYTVSVIGANDISVEGYDDALLNSITEDTPEIAAAKAELERLKADLAAKMVALTLMNINDPNYADAETAWIEAQNAYASARTSLAALTNLQGATVSQTFKVPDALVGAKNVQYVAVHDTNPFADDLAAVKQAMGSAYNEWGVNGSESAFAEYERLMYVLGDIESAYDAWEEENGSSAEFGTVTVSDDGKIVTATYAVDSFSPFIVYAFVEADEPEYKVIGSPFADVSTEAWYYDAMKYAYDNGLMAGTSATERLFSPDGITTRAQIVTILHRLEGAPVVDYLMRFSDVAEEQWHTEAIRWAASTGITSGTGDGTTFSPNDPITREQFAAFLYRYAQHKGLDVSVGEDTNILSFEDALTVSEYAIPAMQWACGAGIIGGMNSANGGMLLDPQGSATRAQAAVMLQRFCESVNK